MRILDRMEKMTDQKAKATLKGQSWASAKCGVRKAGKYDVEITKIEPIDGGVQVFARAWKDGAQIGFGKDGSVDIERFRFFNPPILVENEDGDIVRETVGHDGKKNVRRLKEDADAAMLESLEQVIFTVARHGEEKIVVGKIGKTTSTFYPAAGANSPCDGQITNAGEGWSAVRDAASGKSADVTTNEYLQTVRNYGSDIFELFRTFFSFDKTTLGTDIVDSASLSLKATGNYDNSLAETLHLTEAHPAGTNTLVVGDWDEVENTSFGSLAVASWSATNWNTLSLNNAGISFLSSQDIVTLALRFSCDVNNSAPGVSYCWVGFYTADYGSTTFDPKLVVEHSSPTSISKVSGVSYSDVSSYKGTPKTSIMKLIGIS